MQGNMRVPSNRVSRRKRRKYDVNNTLFKRWPGFQIKTVKLTSVSCSVLRYVHHLACLWSQAMWHIHDYHNKTFWHYISRENCNLKLPIWRGTNKDRFRLIIPYYAAFTFTFTVLQDSKFLLWHVKLIYFHLLTLSFQIRSYYLLFICEPNEGSLRPIPFQTRAFPSLTYNVPCLDSKFVSFSFLFFSSLLFSSLLVLVLVPFLFSSLPFPSLPFPSLLSLLFSSLLFSSLLLFFFFFFFFFFSFFFSFSGYLFDQGIGWFLSLSVTSLIAAVLFGIPLFVRYCRWTGLNKPRSHQEEKRLL